MKQQQSTPQQKPRPPPSNTTKKHTLEVTAQATAPLPMFIAGTGPKLFAPPALLLQDGRVRDGERPDAFLIRFFSHGSCPFEAGFGVSRLGTSFGQRMPGVSEGSGALTRARGLVLVFQLRVRRMT